MHVQVCDMWMDAARADLRKITLNSMGCSVTVQAHIGCRHGSVGQSRGWGHPGSSAAHTPCPVHVRVCMCALDACANEIWMDAALAERPQKDNANQHGLLRNCESCIVCRPWSLGREVQARGECRAA